MTPEEAELEADVFLSVIKGKQFEMPVYFDLEEKKQFDLGKEKALTNPPAPFSYDGISVEITVDGKKYSGKLNKA